MSFDMDPKRERQCLEQMLERRCDGIVTFLTRFGPLKALVEEFWTSQMPFVVVGLPGDIGEVHIDGLRININTGMEKAVDHLVSLGHREIVMVASWPAESNTGADRFPGLKEGFRKNGIPFSDDNIFFHYTGNQLHDGHVAARELLKRRPKTTAVIGVNDILITGFMRSLQEMGLKVPDDISLIGTDNTWIGQEWPVSLTTIDQKTPELAQKAVETLFLRMNSQEWDEPRHIYLETDLIVRESTGPVRQG
jgi:LacI family transcriptional regulator